MSSGNAYHDLEEYVISKEILNVEKLKSLKAKYFKTEYFVKESYVSDCALRFKLGDEAKIIKYNNKGLVIEIISIEKYPDDPDKHTVISTFGAYYSYKFECKKRYKKDDGCKPINQFHKFRLQIMFCHLYDSMKHQNNL